MGANRNRQKKELRKKYCVISGSASIGKGTKLGNFILIRDNTKIGKDCVIGSYVDIEGDVVIGSNVSIQSGCYITRGVVIEDDVFLGPRVVTMNDKKMAYRRKNLKFVRKAPHISRGARVGGGCMLMPGVTIGENSVIGAGSVVTDDIPPRVISFGNPAKVAGKVRPNEII